jgi:hypothetical protein
MEEHEKGPFSIVSSAWVGSRQRSGSWASAATVAAATATRAARDAAAGRRTCSRAAEHAACRATDGAGAHAAFATCSDASARARAC